MNWALRADDEIIVIMTAEPCSKCGTAIGIVAGENLEECAPEGMSEYPVSFSVGWTDGYDHPVYLYCDNPSCSWHGVAEWEEVNAALPGWADNGARPGGER